MFRLCKKQTKCDFNWVSEATLQVTLSLRPLRKCVLLGEKQSLQLKLFVRILQTNVSLVYDTKDKIDFDRIIFLAEL